MENVILVDEQDNAIGTMEKMEAHKQGKLHRAFSILLFNSRGEILIQKRAGSKYHCGGLWTNTCCSHPNTNESMEETTRRRLRFEMGIDTKIEFAYKFIYRAPLDKNLIEHELDYVFIGIFDGTPAPNPAEVEDWKFVRLSDLKQDIEANPNKYTPWFRLIVAHEELNSFV